MNRVARKIIAGDAFRQTRFHDEKGNFVGLPELVHLPQNLVFLLGRLCFGRYPGVPWVTFKMLDRLESLISPDWSMVEFGSGMSTSWFAQRVTSLHSIEHDPNWYEIVRARLEAQRASNVRYELRPVTRYDDLTDHADASLDFALVDGAVRSACVRSVLPKLKRGGWLFLDNSDKDMTVPGGDMRTAEQLVRCAAAERDGELLYLTGMTVAMLSAHQALLARL